LLARRQQPLLQPRGLPADRVGGSVQHAVQHAVRGRRSAAARLRLPAANGGAARRARRLLGRAGRRRGGRAECRDEAHHAAAAPPPAKKKTATTAAARAPLGGLPTNAPHWQPTAFDGLPPHWKKRWSASRNQEVWHFDDGDLLIDLDEPPELITAEALLILAGADGLAHQDLGGLQARRRPGTRPVPALHVYRDLMGQSDLGWLVVPQSEAAVSRARASWKEDALRP